MMGLRPSHLEAMLLASVAAHAGADLRGPGEAPITGATVDSKDVRPGDLFGALPGLKVHGALFAAEAVAAGALAVLTDEEGARLARGIKAPLLVSPEPRVAIGRAAAAIYGDPSRNMTVVGVTGTNGKTTTAYFIDAALRRIHPRTGILGTVELRIADEAIESPRTTVEAPALQALLARMLEEGCSAATAEVSSHAAALHRISGTEFAVAVFTNLQWDHLDFHETMDGYFKDKARLFEPGRSHRGVISIDDEYGVRLAGQAKIPVVTVATRPESRPADWRVGSADIGLDGVGSSFELVGPGKARFEAASPLPGLVNVSNAALAIVAAVEAGVPVEEAIEGVAKAHAIPGRMERVIERSPEDPLAIVDYAHTPDALTLALEAVRAITPGRLILVFGSDGDRDKGKRPVMGEIAAKLADIIVLTDENPRSEEPSIIRAAIKYGIERVRPGLKAVEEVSPRWDAVARGLEIARPGDTVLVTGKGHEPTQEIAGVFHRYNDRDAFKAAHERIVAARTGGKEKRAGP
ncbi:MAG: UDP-N-acetylmuramoyl-L-alanyl-D-glutamate--2,6-diaminopimelate ligase [Demequinaceae bacterium]|nr:UDP-N-acetylmuramoyl-L-alanyl-D-glutamate--2,6-diaminopimelate ligase [Demequinaceae bacterium]